jgi:biopolymer transport protein ExbB
MLEFLGLNFTALIIFAAAAHFLCFLWLLRERKRTAKGLKAFLDDIVRPFSQRSDFDPNISIDDQISRYVRDWREALDNPERCGDRGKLARLAIKDEKKPYLDSSLDTKYNVLRTAIESYPLLGILGTLFAMALALSENGTGAALQTAGGDITMIISAFKGAIWSTVWGLLFAVGFMLFNAWVETGFTRLEENRAAVSDVVLKTKQIQLCGGE